MNLPPNNAGAGYADKFSLRVSGWRRSPAACLRFPVIIHITPNMKLLLLSAMCFCSLLLAGCTSSSGITGKSAAPAAVTKSSIYDPATDTTTIKNGGYEWRLKGNQSNVMMEARP